MTANPLGKKLLKGTGIFLGILLVLLIGFHFWFKANALHIIEDLVESKSNGKVKLKVSKFKFNYFTKKIELEKAVFYTVDSTNASTTYRFSVRKINLIVQAILPIVFKKRLLIETLELKDPDIEVTRLRRIESKDTVSSKKDVSIPEEMGKVYKSIQDALEVLKVNRFEIKDGIFTLINKIQPDQLPLTVSNIDFHIDNLEVDSSKLTGDEKILFSDNIVFKSRNQNIILPDGRHRISFSKFRINLKKRVVEFDSCTIAATKGDSSSASFNVFFDVLLLTKIDFDTLYKTEVIKADSVYCVNPKFTLDVKLDKKKGSSKSALKLEDIVQQLTGNMQLANVVVSNADFNITTLKNGNPNSFTFSNNNFEVRGLSVDQNALKPLKVKSFAMAIRNYENFIKDSVYSVQFDSVLFKDDRIILSNFVFHKLENGKIINTFSIPQFNLQGLSWDDLVFEKRLKADQAIMFRPTISYTASASKRKKGKQNVFQSLGAVNDYMDLNYMEVVDGMIELKLKNNLQLELENANVSLKSNSLFSSKKISGIKNSLTNLSFKKGNLKAGNLTIDLNDIRYIGESGEFTASSLDVKNKEKNMAITLTEVAIQKLLVDEVSANIIADGVNWKKGKVTINPGSNKKSNAAATSFELRNIRGANTIINTTVNGKSISTNLTSIFFNELIKKQENKIILNGLDVTGKQLRIKDNTLNLSIADYDITDNKKSSFRQIIYKSNNDKMNADVSIPALSFIPHIQPLLYGDIAFDEINMLKPVITLSVDNKKVIEQKKEADLPKISISNIRINQPKINFVQVSDSGTITLDWHGERYASNFLQLAGLQTTSGNVALKTLNFYLTDFLFNNSNGQKFSTGEGKISAQINNIQFENENNILKKWNANVASFDADDLKIDSLGRSKGSLLLKKGILNNLNINSSTITNLQKLAAANGAFQLKQVTGQYTDQVKLFNWYNAGFNRNSKTFSLDSFSFNPALERDSFIAKQTFQTDYINLKSGAVSIGPLDIDTYIKENKLNIGTATIDNFLFTDYKDKQLPFNGGIVKPLPVNMIKKIPQQISVDTILLTNANVVYTEVSEKTKQPGTIPVTRMTIKLLNFKNYNIGATDSLSVQANGYLMDTAWIRLRLKESYTDSLGGFLMTLRVKPIDLTILNPALIPLASIKLESGFLDTLSMRAVGREFLSLGEMKMYYHDLKIRLLKNADEKKKTFFTSIISFIANSFVVKKNNSSRIGKVFFIRKRDRSAINYLIKIAMSGMASSAGVKSNKKIMRKYEKELEKRNLPPIDFE